MKFRKMPVVILLATLAASLIWFIEPPKSDSSSPGGRAEVERDEFVPSPFGEAFAFEGQLVAHSASFRQSITYGQALDPDDPTQLQITNSDPSGATPPEFYAYSAAFEIAYVASRSRDDFVVGGISGTGDTVIQRWRHKLKQGVPGSVSYIMKRKELYRGSGLGELHALGFDPDNGYVLAIAGGNLLQIPLPLGGIATTVFDSIAIPQLSFRTPYIFPMLHDSGTLVWVLGSREGAFPTQTTLIFDQDRDGTFENWQVFPNYTALEASAYHHDSWIDDFIVN